MRRLLPLFAALLPLCALADDYPRQLGIDVQHYVFRVSLADDSDEITGETTILLRFVQPGVTAVSLDLAGIKDGKGMRVSAVTSDSGPISYLHHANRLTLTLQSAPTVGERRAFTVNYQGVPANGLHFGRNRHGDRTIFSWNWPTFAREWLPVIDHPYDKATSEFLVSAPAHYQVVANGALVETRDLGNARRLTHWKESVPIATWLNNIGVAEFAVRTFDTLRGVPLQTWVFPQDRDNGIATFESPMRQALDFFAEFIGPYPYEKLAGVQVNGMGGGMEHASAVFYGEREVNGRPASSLVAHEVSHQWWGDSVTEKDWNDAWLSEGFATYFAALAQEHYLGRDAFLATMSRSRASIFQMEKKSPVPVIHDNLPEIRDGHAPTGLVYQKGGWTLHMLRALLGDVKFQAGLREYFKRFRDSNASTDDLQRVMEETSGQELGWFFTQWLRRETSPIVEGKWSYNAAAKKVVLDFAQTQTGQPFRLSLPVTTIVPGSTPTVTTLVLTSTTGSFDIPVEKEPDSIVLDQGITVLMNAALIKSN